MNSSPSTRNTLYRIGMIAVAAWLTTGCKRDGETLILHEDYWAVKECDPPYTVGEAKARYGEPETVVTNEYSMDMVYSNFGISFVCHDPNDIAGRMWDMIVYPPFKLSTTDGIVLGKSTAADARICWGK